MAFTLTDIGPDWDGRWDSLLKESAGAGFMQSSAWSRFKRLEGYTTPRYGLFEEGVLCGGAMLLQYKILGANGLLVCPDGPLLPWSEPERARDGLRLIVRAAEQLASQSGELGLRIEPRLPAPRPSLLRNWTRSPVDLNPIHSLVLDLGYTNNELLAQMQPKGRYNIRLSERHGVRVTQSSEMRDIRRFFALFADTATRSGFFGEPFSFFLNLGAALFPSGMAELFFAEWRGETLAAAIVIHFGARATYLYGGSSSNARSVMPTYALHWAIAQAARDRGCTEYDLYGYDPFEQPDHPYSGFSRFKRQFGGRRLDAVGAHDLIFYDRLADSIAARLMEYA